VFVLLTLWIVWRTRRSLFKWLVIALLLVCGAVGGALYKVNEESMLTRQLATPLGEDMRTHIWRAALAQHAESPWIGVGSRMFYEGGITHRDLETPAQTGDSLFAHNEYLQMLADYGWAGLALVVLVVFAHLMNGIRFLRWFAAEKFPATGMLGSNSLALTLGSIAALVATLVHAVFEFHGHVPDHRNSGRGRARVARESGNRERGLQITPHLGPAFPDENRDAGRFSGDDRRCGGLWHGGWLCSRRTGRRASAARRTRR
jgi:O-antigen ligase